MKLLCAYYKLDRFGQRCGRERCQEHAVNAQGKPLCGAAMDNDAFVWKPLNTSPNSLCTRCQKLLTQKVSDEERLKQWEAGEPIR